MPDNLPYDEKELLLKIAEGDEQAFTILFNQLVPRLLPFITRITRGNENLAKEMVQETFLRVWIKRDQLNRIEHPSTYIHTIASNLAVSHLRKESNRVRLLQASLDKALDQSPYHAIEMRDLTSFIDRAVEELPDRRKQLYKLSRRQGLSHTEIAAQTGLSIQTIRNQLGLALQFIKNQISKETGLSIAFLFLLLEK